MIETDTIVAALTGGALIGASAVAMLWLNGRVLGVSGQLAEIFTMTVSDRPLRMAFIAGIIAGAAFYAHFVPGALGNVSHRPLSVVIAGGLLVGLGTRRGGGCTSGHGVCGLARMSARSLTATATFMMFAMATVAATRFSSGAI